MRLHEEYLKRHDLDVPLVCYDNRSTVFLRSKGSPCAWRILSIVWRQPESWHPGFFELCCSDAIHNGYQQRRLMSEVFRPRRWYWDTYEESLLDFASELREDFQAIPSESSTLAVWQMFLYIFDSSLVSLGDGFFHQVYESLCSPDRHQAQEEILIRLRDALPEAYDIWHHQVAPMTINYSEWLVDLING